MKIGLFGGTFNPPHLGHVRLLEHFSEQIGFDKIFVVPDKRPVLKIDALAAVVCNDGEVFLHSRHVKTCRQDIFKLVIKAFQRQDCFLARLTACH